MVDKIKELRSKIHEVRGQIKQRERERWSESERKEIDRREECPVDFFRIIYKLSVLDRMERYLNTFHCLPNSFRWMLNYPFYEWGDRVLMMKSSGVMKDPELLAMKKGL